LVRKLAAWGLLAAVLLSGCGKGAPAGNEPAQALTKVRFTEVIHSIFYAPQYVAQAKGYFQAEGIDLDFSTAQGSDKGTAALLAGTADVALVGPETTVFVYNQESPVKVKLFAQMTATDGSFLLARQPGPSFNWADLKGKSVIGWRVGSMPQMFASAAITKAGLDPKQDVDYISNLAAPAMAGAFQSGQGQYLQAYEPLAGQLEQQGEGVVVASLGQAVGNIPVTGYVATDRYIAEHPDVVQRYTNAIYRARLYLEKTDPATIAIEVAPYFEGTDVKLLAASIKRYKEIGAWKATPVMEPQDFDQLQSLMIAGGVLEPSKRAPFAKIAVNTFAEKAVQEIK
jgi:NitT/TauT family transport system substrate-binding protein